MLAGFGQCWYNYNFTPECPMLGCPFDSQIQWAPSAIIRSGRKYLRLYIVLFFGKCSTVFTIVSPHLECYHLAYHF
jgi:hypothetical protein